MQVTQGSLALVGLNTTTPAIYWNGVPIPNITNVRVDWDADEQRIKLRADPVDAILAAELAAAGISMKKEGKHHE